MTNMRASLCLAIGAAKADGWLRSDGECLRHAANGMKGEATLENAIAASIGAAR